MLRLDWVVGLLEILGDVESRSIESTSADALCAAKVTASLYILFEIKKISLSRLSCSSLYAYVHATCIFTVHDESKLTKLTG
jgi:hypothetical protein